MKKRLTLLGVLLSIILVVFIMLRADIKLTDKEPGEIKPVQSENNISKSENNQPQKSDGKTVSSESPLPEEKIPPVPGTTIEPSPGSTAASEKAGESTDGELELLFGGDVLLSDALCSSYEKDGIGALFTDEILTRMQDADICMLNQEFPFSTRGAAMEEKQYTFRAKPDNVRIFQNMGVDIVTLANNHTLDFGTPALLDTLTTLEDAEIPYVGAGETLTRAKALITLERAGRTIGFLGASRVVPHTDWYAKEDRPGLFTTYDPTALLEEIKKADNQCDLLVVYVHWGVEYQSHPEDYQKQMARQYIDAGADIVVGSHPHVLQGIEYYNGKPIFYSLGNFVFGQWAGETIMPSVKMDNAGNLTITLIPLNQKNNQTYILENPESLFRNLQNISSGIQITPTGAIQTQESTPTDVKKD